jgi:peptide/nickel transport system permease protein
MGATDAFIITRHIVPNIAASLVVQAATAMSGAVVLASALDFLGIGTRPPDPSWGNMLQSSRPLR